MSIKELDNDMEINDKRNGESLPDISGSISTQRKSIDIQLPLQVAQEKDEFGEANDEIDIDLTDPEVDRAATKIQAGFKGMKARKEVSEIFPQKTYQKF